MSSTSTLVVFIIGAGSHISKSIAEKFKLNGYAVAFGSRNPDKEAIIAAGYHPIVVDASQLESLQSAFEVVSKELGAPNVVIYNAATFDPPADKQDPLSLSSSVFSTSSSIGLGVFHAAQAALPGFRSSLHSPNPKSFIVTGNILPFVPPANPLFIGLGTQKTISARLVNTFSHAYNSEGIRFYFASLVSKEGKLPGPDFEKSGPAHAKVYWELTNQKEQTNWDHRFTLDGIKYPNY